MSEMGGTLNRSTQHFIFNGKMECIVMGHRYRRGFTAAQKVELWDRWQRGESLNAIGRKFEITETMVLFEISLLALRRFQGQNPELRNAVLVHA